MLEAMPSVMLGASILVSMVIALVLRRLVMARYIHGAPLFEQPRRQFILEYALFTMAGFMAISANKFYYGIGYDSGSMFFIGFLAFGFFIALDLSLDRERAMIEERMNTQPSTGVPDPLRPMTRKFFMVALVTTLYVMVIIILIISRDLSWLKSMDSRRISLLMPATTQTIFKEITFVMALLLLMVVNILISYSRNLKILFETETSILESVSKGDLSRFVPVATNDEFGAIAGYTNTMIRSLRDHIRMLTALKVATEVQKNMLPSKAPAYPGIDMAGTILYCQEVGGDYFDYMALPGNRLGIAVTDSAGHGVGAALHMTTARAFMRFAAESYQGPTVLVNDVNRHLARDSCDTGRFATLFFLEIDASNKTLKWVRAGHEPALFLDPDTGSFQVLMGEGMALGVDETMEAREYLINGWAPGAILVIFSDGLKEARNKEGEMFGGKRIRRAVKQHRNKPAARIQAMLIKEFERFTAGVPMEDDITMVIIRLL
ncbi:MAG: SpoIIE family protein phosphatase [Desulfobacteraceae bacterium]|nr:SpoIIE family protein phosphatase [Desulfobacteraceae bacterium]